MRLLVIPARGGSKRIPKKNIKLFHGKPMIAWSIEKAIASKCFDRIVVSTDDQEIAEVSNSYGAEVPFVRPQELSGDYVATIPVVAHAIEWHLKQGMLPEQVCCLYPTAPFVSVQDLKSGLDLLQKEACQYAFSVVKYPFPIQRAIRINQNTRVEMFYPECFGTRSQDLEEAYHDAGQFYWGKSSAWLDNVPIFSVHASPVIIPTHRVQDIDTPEDWKRAEILFDVLHKSLVENENSISR